MAAECGLSIVSSIAQYLVEPTRRQLGYAFCFKSFVEELSKQKEKLAQAQDRVQNAVEDAEDNDEEIEKDVEKWMEDAEKIMTDVTLLEGKMGDAKMKCFAGWCPNLFQQYKLSKEAEEKTTMLKELEDETNSSKFRRVGHKAPVQIIDFLPSKDFIPLNSPKEASEEIIEALKDDKVNMIGLYGMPGVGKTTLVKEVGRKAKELRLFDRVLMVVVSQTPDPTRIQDRLAENLGVLPLKATTKEGRAEQLLHRLQREKKVLIILDDVWEYLGTEDLKNMGIAFDDVQKNKGWKILLTTRLHTVCTSMDCQKKIFLELLPENDAWDLFKAKANLSDEDHDLNIVAKKVAKKCKGLPIAIVVVGTALRGKRTVKEWEVALRQLKTLLKDIKHAEREKNVFACLKMSYDYLSKDAKFCLLLCSLFPEDHEIPIEDLTRYAIGCGVCNDGQSMEEARDQVFVTIKELRDSCLLLDASKRDHVKMHDLVREVAIEVASQEEHVFLVKADIGLKEWPTNIKSFENFTAISLMGNDIAQLPNGLVCPRLKILMLGRAPEYGYHQNVMLVPEKFFEGMEALQVLSLKGASLSLQALERLVNLQFLELIKCECRDVTAVRNLQGLEIFRFDEFNIKELPNEMGELEKLRLLDLTWCRSRIPRKLIERFQNLEELYIEGFGEWDAARADAQRMNAGLGEINSLSKLSAISLAIPKVESVVEEFVLPHLRRYVITNGKWSPTELPTSRKLIFRFDHPTYFNAKPFKQLFLNVCELELSNIEGYKNIVPEIAGGFEDLVDLHACRCLGMECLVDITQQQYMSTTAFLNLKDIRISDMASLRELCKGQPPMGFLHKLQTLSVFRCDDICTIFPAKLWQALQNLEAVEIKFCRQLKEVFELDRAFYEGNEVLLLSRLTTLKLTSCRRMTFVFTLPLAQSLLRLETLVIDQCAELEHIIREKKDHDDDVKEQTIQKPLCFPKLTTLRVTNCDKLEYVFPVSVAPSLVHLEELLIYDARHLKRIFGSSREGEALAIDRDGILMFPRLRKLRLQPLFDVSPLCSFGPQGCVVKLPSLQCLETMGYKVLSNAWAQLQGLTSLKELQICNFFNEEHELRDIWNCLTLENLTSLEVTKCFKLRRIFPSGIISSLVPLKSLKIIKCSELEEIIARDNEDEKDAIVLGSRLPSLCFPNLCEIEVTDCYQLKSLFPITIAAGHPQLKSLKVSTCNALKEIFARDNEDEKDAIVLRGHLPSQCFPNLYGIEVFRCQKLKSLFPVTIAVGLPQLKYLRISMCPALKEIIASDNANEKDALEKLKVQGTSQPMDRFGSEDKAAGINVEKQIVFPNLVELSLVDLPELVYFCPPNYHVIVPRKVTLELIRCPKMNTTFTTRTDGGFIAKSKVPEEGQHGLE